MAEEIKRMRFFNGLFLTEEEFNLEQRYHLRFRQLHNQWFHGRGVIEGLEVKPGPEQKVVTITKGAALGQAGSAGEEMLGPEIVLAEDYNLDLSSLQPGEATYVTIQYGEEVADVVEDKGAGEKIHWWEKPVIGHQATLPVDDKSKVTLAKVLFQTLEGATEPSLIIQYQTAGQEFRSFAGFSGKQVETEKLILRTPDGTGKMPYLEAKADDSLNHGIKITTPSTNLTGNLSLEGGLHVGGVQEPQPGNLEVEGNTLLDQDLSVKGNAIIGQDTRAGNVTVKGGLQVSGGPVGTVNNLTVAGAGQIQGNMTVGGTGIIQGDTRIGSDAVKAELILKGNLKVTGNPAVSQALQVDGTTRIGNEAQPANLIVTGAAQVDGNSTVAGQLIVNNHGAIQGNLTVQNDLVVGTAVIKQAEGSSNLAINGGLHVGGTTNPEDRNLIVAGTALIKGETTIGETSAPANLTVTGDLTVKGATTTINTVNLDVQDNIVLLNKSAATSVPTTLQSGLEIYRGRNALARLIWEENTKKWKIGMQGAALTELATIDHIPTGILRDIPNSQADFTPALGQAVYFNGTKYSLAIANDEAKIGMFMVGRINKIVNGVTHFTLVQAGYIENLSAVKDEDGAALIPGEYYFVSASQPGVLTTKEPDTISNPIFLAETASSGYVLPFRPSERESEEPDFEQWLSDEIGNISFVTGNVGIGKANPQSKLEVTGETTINGSFNVAGMASIQDPVSPLLKLVRSTIDPTSLQVRTGNGYGEIATEGTAAFQITTNSEPRLYVTGAGQVGIGTITPGTDTLHVKGRGFASEGWHVANADYAEFFESFDQKPIPVGTSVVLTDTGTIRPAKTGEIPIGIISATAAIVGNSQQEWPEKYLRDEFGRKLLVKTKVPVMVPQKIKTKKQRQQVMIKTEKKEIPVTEVVFKDGKYCQVKTTKTVIVETEEPLFKEVDLYDESGSTLIGKHRFPLFEEIEAESEVLDKNGNRVLIDSGKYEWQELPSLNPAYKDTPYIPREERPEWHCVGLLGIIPLLRGQPAAPTWIRVKKAVTDVELWLVK